MRKIKFRAWDKIDKKIYKVIGIDWYDKTCKVQSDDYEFRELNDSIFDDLIFIQFTGLKDKNGKEICGESDIFIHNKNKYIFIDTVNFGLVAVCINEYFGDILNDRTLRRKHDWRDFHWVYNTQKYLEIISNIYEGEIK